MRKPDSHIQSINTEEDIKKIASYDERKSFVRSRFDSNYTGKTPENQALLKNEKFKKAYLEKFSRQIKNYSRKARMDLVSNRPENNPQIQKVRESFFSKIGGGLTDVFRGIQQTGPAIDRRITAGRQAIMDYSGKVVRQFSSVKLTGYFPPPKGGYRNKQEANMEGGPKDRIGKPLYTLEQYLRGEAPYVSIAGHRNIAYGTRVRLANLEARYGRPIDCRVVDTGKAFNKTAPFTKLDVCVQDKRMSMTDLVNTNTPVQQIA